MVRSVEPVLAITQHENLWNSGQFFVMILVQKEPKISVKVPREELLDRKIVIMIFK